MWRVPGGVVQSVHERRRVWWRCSPSPCHTTDHANRTGSLIVNGPVERLPPDHRRLVWGDEPPREQRVAAVRKGADAPMTTAAMVLAGIALFVAACGVPSLALGPFGGSSVGRSTTARAGSGERGQAATATPPPTVVSERHHYGHGALVIRACTCWA